MEKIKIQHNKKSLEKIIEQNKDFEFLNESKEFLCNEKLNDIENDYYLGIYLILIKKAAYEKPKAKYEALRLTLQYISAVYDKKDKN